MLPPHKEDYRMLVSQEWSDLHHSRVQEWTALGVVTGAHLGLIQIVRIVIEYDALPTEVSLAVVPLASIVGVMFSALGILMTCRHRRLMQIKLTWIYDAESKLGLVKSDDNPDGILPESPRIATELQWRGLGLPRLLSTSGVILMFYIVILLLDIIALTYSL